MVRGGGERTAHRGGLGGRSLYRRVALMNRPSFRPPLGRAIGLGSAKSGWQHWLVQRVSIVPVPGVFPKQERYFRESKRNQFRRKCASTVRYAVLFRLGA